MRDFFPGQPFRNSYKSRGYRNIHGRCTPGTPGAAGATRVSRAIWLAVLATAAFLLRP